MAHSETFTFRDDCGSGALTPLKFIRTNQMEDELTRAMADVLCLVHSAINSRADDIDFATWALSCQPPEEPLSKFEIAVLAVGLLLSHQGKAFDCSDVLAQTDRFWRRPMNTAMAYRTVKSLLDRGLISEDGRELDERTERYSRTFQVNDSGRIAVELAILTERHLALSRRHAA
jgi:hypothetical protein